ncbi:hypothetical protein P4493_09985 [Bacillus thuringiensis]|uniref:Uncharacterized protein n=3 Tax=Bacillus thuringiensis TaxID=1428 RepID=A0AB35PAY5_BACTU|nr:MULTISPECIES: hypothetical protein [Bacillus]AFQ30388.1 hypothetical protein BTF1_31442 [Bacillus thuringiensis HD-789]AJH02465.1 hypothetical protein AS86_6650 [Bacillus thuringiensis HD1002]AND28576.1 hypothetical protein ATN07_33235 [Bacillus thuringiensis serovar israelensis]ARO21380.1 hypothetical protein B2J90_28600 [Bacillus cereus]EXL36744.1 hypothetical protein BG78_23255 [Bacillus thuringiensis serovar israelensis]
MKIYRGNIGVDLSLEEFSQIIEDEDKIDDLLNIIYELEMDEVMNYNKEDILAFEANLFQEVAEYQRKQNANDDTVKMERILAHLEKYGR